MLIRNTRYSFAETPATHFIYRSISFLVPNYFPNSFLKVVDTEAGKQIQLINRKSLRTLTAQLLVLLMSWDGTSFLSVEQLKQHYETIHSTSLNPCEYGFMTLTELLKSLPYLVEV